MDTSNNNSQEKKELTADEIGGKLLDTHMDFSDAWNLISQLEKMTEECAGQEIRPVYKALINGVTHTNSLIAQMASSAIIDRLYLTRKISSAQLAYDLIKNDEKMETTQVIHFIYDKMPSSITRKPRQNFPSDYHDMVQNVSVARAMKAENRAPQSYDEALLPLAAEATQTIKKRDGLSDDDMKNEVIFTTMMLIDTANAINAKNAKAMQKIGEGALPFKNLSTDNLPIHAQFSVDAMNVVGREIGDYASSILLENPEEASWIFLNAEGLLSKRFENARLLVQAYQPKSAVSKIMDDFLTQQGGMTQQEVDALQGPNKVEIFAKSVLRSLEARKEKVQPQ